MGGKLVQGLLVENSVLPGVKTLDFALDFKQGSDVTAENIQEWGQEMVTVDSVLVRCSECRDPRVRLAVLGWNIFKATCRL